MNASDALATLESTAGKLAGERRARPSGWAWPRCVTWAVPGGRTGGRPARVAAGPYRDLADFAARTGLPAAALEALATAGAFGCFGLSRRAALWAAGAAASVREGQLPGTTRRADRAAAARHDPGRGDAGRRVGHQHLRHSSGGPHPGGAAARRVLTASSARSAAAPIPPWPWPAWSPTGSGRRPRAGVVFLSLEDETGMLNVICPPHVWDRHRRIGHRPRPRCSSTAGSSAPAAPSTWSPPPCARSASQPPSPAATSADPRPASAPVPALVPRPPLAPGMTAPMRHRCSPNRTMPHRAVCHRLYAPSSRSGPAQCSIEPVKESHRPRSGVNRESCEAHEVQDADR